MDCTTALALFRRSCQLDHVSGCAMLGLAMLTRWDTTGTDSLGARLLVWSCGNGYGAACFETQFLYEAGRGVARDSMMAWKAALRACELGSPEGCNNAGAKLANGEAVEVDIPRALTFYRRGCEMGNGLACRNIGRVLHGGLGVPKDEVNGKAYIERACALHDEEACELLADG
jgi:uncharacterized protein